MTFFTTGGTISIDKDVLYIARNADEDLLRICETGDFAYVLTARQMGKSSLMVRTAARLKEKNILPVIVSLDMLGRDLTVEQWYLGVIRRILRNTSIKFNAPQWWRENADMGVVERLMTFLEDILLQEVDQPIVIFFDEIDTTLSLDFTDDFYAAIRAIYNMRSAEAVFQRLSFVLIGTATPSDLISDATRTPFNVGREVVLTDFTREEAMPFIQGFPFDEAKSQQIFDRIYYWTSGHPYLTQKLCIEVVNLGEAVQSVQDVDELVQRAFFSQETIEDLNLQFVRDMLTLRVPELYQSEIISIYQQIVEGYYLADDHTSLAQNHLKLCGIVRVSNRRLIVRNRIYTNVFNSGWLRQTIEDFNLTITPGQAQRVYVETVYDLPEDYVYLIATEADKKNTEPLISFLTEQGVTIWHKEQESDDDLGLIQQAIKSARAVLYIASPDTLNSTQSRRELDLAQLSKKTIVGVWVSGNERIDAIPTSIINWQFIDLRVGREANLKLVLQAIMDSKIPVIDQTFQPRNPYKGLKAFGENDVADFFGRADLTNKFIAHLNQQLINHKPRFLAIIGASGSGKSSLVKAGLIPALRRGELPDSGFWTYIDPIVPGSSPFVALAEALAKTLNWDVPKILNVLHASDHAGLIHALANDGNRPTLIFIDQFEEIFTLTQTEEERESFINLIVEAVTAPNSPIIIIIAMRADFFEYPTYYPRLGQLISDYGRTVLEMSRRELLEAIEKPAHQDSVRLILDDRLTDEILYDLRDQYNQLPLLQFTLDQLYQQRDGNQLTINAYRRIGRVTGALSRHAQNTYDNLPSDTHRSFARSIFTRLIVLGETIQDTTRRRAYRSEFQLDNAEENKIMADTIDAFVNARLLVTNQAVGNASLEIGHEALIRQWDLYGTWITEAKEDIRFQDAFTSDTKDWVRTGKKEEDRLYRGGLLDQALEWMERNIPSGDEREFVQRAVELRNRLAEEERIRHLREQETAQRASTFEDRARQFRRAAAILAGFMALALLVTFIAITQVRDANSQVNSVETQVAAARDQELDAHNNATAQQAEVFLLETHAISAQQEVDLAAQLAYEAYADVETATAQLAVQQMTQAAVQQAANTAEQAANSAATDVFIQAQSAENFEALAATAEALAGTANANVDVANQMIFEQQSTALAVQQTATIAVETAVFAETQIANLNDSLGNQRTQEAVIAEANIQRTQSAILVPTADKAQELLAEAIFAATQQSAELVNLSVQEQEIRDTINALQLLTTGQTVLEIGEDLQLPLSIAVESNRNASPPVIAQQFLADQAYYNNVEQVYNFHQADVTVTDLTTDGNIAASGACLPTTDDSCGGGEIVIWDVHTGEALWQFEAHVGPVRDLQFNPDDSLLVSAGCGERDADNACSSGEIKIWDVQSGELLRTLNQGLEINALTFNPAAPAQIVHGGCEQLFEDSSACELAGTIAITDIHTGGTIAEFDNDFQEIDALTFDHSGASVLVGGCTADNDSTCSDGQISEWDVASGERTNTYDGHTDRVNDLAMLPDAHGFISASSDTSLIQWDRTTTEIVREFQVHNEAVNSVDIESTGTHLISGSADNLIILWDIENAVPLLTFNEHTDDIRDARFIPDSNDILSISNDDQILRWQVNFGPQLARFYGHEDGIVDFTMSPDGSQAVSTSRDGSLILWDVRSQQPVFTMTGHSDRPDEVAFSPDGRFIASNSCAQRDNKFNICLVGEVIIWDAATGYEVQRLAGDSSWLQDMAYSPDGSLLATAGCSAYQEIDGEQTCVQGEVLIRDAASGEILQRLEPHQSWVHSIAFAPDSQTMLTSGCVLKRNNCEQGEITIWQVSDWIPVDTLTGHAGWIGGLAFHPDGRQFVSGASDNTLILWNLDRREMEQPPWVEHTNNITDVQFSPDGRTVLSASDDNTLILWDVTAGERRATLIGHSNDVRAAAFTNDGNLAVSAAEDGTMVLWQIHDTPAELVNWTLDNRTIRPITCAERRQFNVKPFCIESVMLEPTRYPTLTATPSPDFAAITPTPTTPSEPAPRTPTPMLLPDQTVVQALDGIGLSQSSGMLTADVIGPRVIDMSDVESNRDYYQRLGYTLNPQLASFVASTTFTWGQGSELDACGLYLRFKDNANFSAIQVNRNGTIDFNSTFRSDAANTQSRVSDAVNLAPTDTNELSIVALDDHFSVFLNRQYVAQFVGDSHTAGEVRLQTHNELEGDETACTFNNTWVWEITDPSVAQLPPPPVPGIVKDLEDIVGITLNQGNLIVAERDYALSITEEDDHWEWEEIEGFISTNDIIMRMELQLDTTSEEGDCILNFENDTSGDEYDIYISRDGEIEIEGYIPNYLFLDSVSGLPVLRTEREVVHDLIVANIGEQFTIFINGQQVAQSKDDSIETDTLWFGIHDSVSDDLNPTCLFNDVLVWEITEPIEQLPPPVMPASAKAELENITGLTLAQGNLVSIARNYPLSITEEGDTSEWAYIDELDADLSTIMRFNLQLDTTNETSECTVMFEDYATDNDYRLEFSRDGEINFGGYLPDWVNIDEVNGIPSLIGEQDRTYDVIVTNIGDQFTVFIDGQQITQFFDDTLQTDTLWFNVYDADTNVPDRTCVFNDVLIWQNTEPTEQIPRPDMPDDIKEEIENISDLELGRGNLIVDERDYYLELIHEDDNYDDTIIDTFGSGSSIIMRTTFQMNTPSVRDVCRIVLEDDVSGDEYQLRFSRDGKISFIGYLPDYIQFGENTGISALTGTQYDDHDVIITNIDNQFTVFVDGQYVAQFTDDTLQINEIYVAVDDNSSDNQKPSCVFRDVLIWEADEPIEQVPSLTMPDDIRRGLENTLGISLQQGNLIAMDRDYPLTVAHRNDTFENITVASFATTPNVIMQTRLRMDTPSEQDICRIDFENSIDNTNYIFQFKREGELSIWRSIEGAWSEIATLTDMQTIANMGQNSTNEVIIANIGREFTIFINGQYFTQVEVAQPQTDRVTIAVQDRVGDSLSPICNFDDVLIWENTETIAPVACQNTVTAARGANVRSGPSTGDAIVSNLPYGTIVEIINQNPDGSWLQVRNRQRTITGWVFANLICR